MKLLNAELYVFVFFQLLFKNKMQLCGLRKIFHLKWLVMTSETLKMCV